MTTPRHIIFTLSETVDGSPVATVDMDYDPAKVSVADFGVVLMTMLEHCAEVAPAGSPLQAISEAVLELPFAIRSRQRKAEADARKRCPS